MRIVEPRGSVTGGRLGRHIGAVAADPLVPVWILVALGSELDGSGARMEFAVGGFHIADGEV